MPWLEIVLWIVAGLVGLSALLFAIAGLFVFLGAMSMPDLNDDVLGDK